MRIATWNVNSVKARLPNVVAWLEAAQPDVLCLQETKCRADDFPRLEFAALGYRAEVVGQPSYNGVALLSKRPAEEVRTGLAGEDSDEQARYIEATFDGVRVASLYLPNGNPTATEKFAYKLRWMDRLHARAAELLAEERPLVLAGDYNVCPTDDDVYDPVGWQGDALCRRESRAKFRALLHLGLTDAFRVLHPEPHLYTFWDYKDRRWERDEGLRIDHLLLSPQAADRLVECRVDKEPRSRERPSDHTAVICDLSG